MVAAASERILAEADVALRDGSTVRVRPVSADDEANVFEFLEGLSDRSRLLRFFSAGADLHSLAHRFADVDGVSAYGLIATAGADAEIVGHAGYDCYGTDTAEVAFAIADSYQGRGLATTLLAHLAAHASARQVATFTAVTRPDNHSMIEVFRESGFPVEVRSGVDVVKVRFPTELSADGWRRFEQRDQIASVAAVDSVLAPKSVALIGASRRRGTVGGEILRNLMTSGYQGVVYPVNPAASAVQAIPAYHSVDRHPDRGGPGRDRGTGRQGRWKSRASAGPRACAASS